MAAMTEMSFAKSWAIIPDACDDDMLPDFTSAPGSPPVSDLSDNDGSWSADSDDETFFGTKNYTLGEDLSCFGTHSAAAGTASISIGNASDALPWSHTEAKALFFPTSSASGNAVNADSKINTISTDELPGYSSATGKLRGSGKRKRGSAARFTNTANIDAGASCSDTDESASTPVSETAAGVELAWQETIRLLRDESFLPGPRPDQIQGEHVSPNLMYKELPKRRRPHSLPTHPRDKWYNTGGIKSASDRFDQQTNFGLRKRYGKVVREGGLCVLRFYEYKLLHRDAKSGEISEQKDGPTLFHLVPESRRVKLNSAHLAMDLRLREKQQAAEIERMRAREASLRLDLVQAQRMIATQAAALEKLQSAE